jgi:hypothetical protein
VAKPKVLTEGLSDADLFKWRYCMGEAIEVMFGAMRRQVMFARGANDAPPVGGVMLHRCTVQCFVA